MNSEVLVCTYVYLPILMAFTTETFFGSHQWKSVGSANCFCVKASTVKKKTCLPSVSIVQRFKRVPKISKYHVSILVSGQRVSSQISLPLVALPFAHPGMVIWCKSPHSDQCGMNLNKKHDKYLSKQN